jgi:hypothetical protein
VRSLGLQRQGNTQGNVTTKTVERIHRVRSGHEVTKASEIAATQLTEPWDTKPYIAQLAMANESLLTIPSYELIELGSTWPFTDERNIPKAKAPFLQLVNAMTLFIIQVCASDSPERKLCDVCMFRCVLRVACAELNALA